MFDQLNKASCIVPPGGVPAVNPLCSDAAFAAANPEICASQSYLIIKPEVLLLCRLGSTTFRVFEYKNNVETEVTDNLVFQSSDDTVFAVGVHTGSGTGLSAGVAEITVTRNGLTAKAEITVLAETTCCNSIAVKSSVLIDNSRSSNLAFGPGYASRLEYAIAVAELFSSKIIPVSGQPKDKIKIWSFTETPDEISSDFTSDEVALAAQITGIAATNNKTDLGSILTAATNDLFDSVADEKVILLISDGEQTANSDIQAILDAATTFKAAGGIIIVVGLRAAGNGYDLLSRIATGGFFINAVPANADLIFEQLNFLKSILCLAQCNTIEGTTNKPQLDYSSFANWEVVSGIVSLYGAGLLDLLPGNGLYVALKEGFPGTIQSIDTFDLVAGQSYRVSFKAAGNNRLNTPTAQQGVKFFLRDVTSAPTDPNVFEHTVSPNWDAGFFDYNFTFVAAHDATVRLSFQQVFDASFTGVWYGNLIDDIRLDEVSTLTNFLTDNFDGENEVYVPPGCGTGSIGHLIPEVNPYFDYFPSLQGKRYYDFAIGDIRFFVLDSDPREPDGVSFDSVQGQWFQTRVGQVTETHKIVVFHHAPFSSGSEHGSNAWMQWPFYDVPGLVAVIAGHDHDYERLSIGDKKYFVVGTGGKSIRGFGSLLGQSIANLSAFGFLKLQLYDTGGIQFQFIQTDGSVFDDNSTGDVGGSVVKTVALFGDWGGDTTDEAAVAVQVIAANPDVIITLGDNYYQNTPQPSLDEQIGKHYHQFIHHYTGAFGAGALLDKFFPTLGNHDWDFLDATVVPAYYSYAVGYNCYGGLCSDLTLQSQDPNPLPNIETDNGTAQRYDSTKTACASCPSGQIDFGHGIIPDMTSNTAPSGVVSASSSDQPGNEFLQFGGDRALFTVDPLPQWCQYQFDTAQVVVGYDFCGIFRVKGDANALMPYPKVYSLQGSNDGATWVTLDTQTKTAWAFGEIAHYRIVNTVAYKYFRLLVTETMNPPANLDSVLITTEIANFNVYLNTPTQQCATASETSYVSQADADLKANASALAAAQAKLSCVSKFTSTQTYTAKCDVGALGTPVTKTITVVSFISQSDADAQALAQAQALAFAELVCTGSNNAQRITINDAPLNVPVGATPYPSVQFISGKTGHVTKATVKINNFTHKSARDVSLLLRAPDGTIVELMRRCGGVCQVSNLNLVFDDAAPTSIPQNDDLCSDPMTSGTFKPTQYDSFIAYPAPCPSGVPNYVLSALIGKSPNGSWSLWVVDCEVLDVGTIDSWSVELTTA